MGYYLQIDEQEPTDIASNRGYGDLIRWAQTLSPHDFSTLHHLTAFGWEQRIGQLITECAQAVKDFPPQDQDTLKTVQNLADVLRTQGQGAVVVSVTNGIG